MCVCVCVSVTKIGRSAILLPDKIINRVEHLLIPPGPCLAMSSSAPNSTLLYASSGTDCAGQDYQPSTFAGLGHRGYYHEADTENVILLCHQVCDYILNYSNRKEKDYIHVEHRSVSLPVGREGVAVEPKQPVIIITAWRNIAEYHRRIHTLAPEQGIISALYHALVDEMLPKSTCT